MASAENPCQGAHGPVAVVAESELVIDPDPGSKVPGTGRAISCHRPKIPVSVYPKRKGPFRWNGPNLLELGNGGPTPLARAETLGHEKTKVGFQSRVQACSLINGKP